MRRLVTMGPGDVAIDEQPAPQPGPGQVVIAVDAVGICGSDLHIFSGTHPYRVLPIVQGHEICGRVVAACDRPTDQLGALVVVDPVTGCGACRTCRSGRPNACPHLEVLGVHRDGGLAEQVVVEADHTHRASGIDPMVGVLIEPMAVALHSLAMAQPRPTDRVVLIGAGSIGRAIVLALAERRVRVLVVDREPSRLLLAAHLGATATLDATQPGGVADAVAAFAGSDGADIVIDATGAPAAVQEALNVVAPTGRVVIVGVSDAKVNVPVSVFTRKELTVVGSRNSHGEFPAATALVRRHRDLLADTISHRVSLDQAPRMLQLACQHPELVTKIVVSPNLSEQEATPWHKTG